VGGLSSERRVLLWRWLPLLVQLLGVAAILVGVPVVLMVLYGVFSWPLVALVGGLGGFVTVCGAVADG